jgi:hypothetical protein
LGEQIHVCPAEHLALQHLQATDVPFDGPLTPGQRDPGLYGGVIVTQSSGKAPEGWEGTRGGARQPCFKLGRLASADEASEVLRESHGVCQLGRRRSQLRQLVAILLRRPLRRAED